MNDERKVFSVQTGAFYPLSRIVMNSAPDIDWLTAPDKEA
ncbi:hypothetical protein SODG_002695 [Sodalis praecaptivus]